MDEWVCWIKRIVIFQGLGENYRLIYVKCMYLLLFLILITHEEKFSHSDMWAGPGGSDNGKGEKLGETCFYIATQYYTSHLLRFSSHRKDTENWVEIGDPHWPYHCHFNPGIRILEPVFISCWMEKVGANFHKVQQRLWNPLLSCLYPILLSSLQLLLT